MGARMSSEKISVFIPGEYDKGFIQSFIKRQSPNNDGIFSYPLSKNSADENGGGQILVCFQVENPKCDYVVQFNCIKQDVEFECYDDKIFSLQQEPYINSCAKYHIPFKNEWFKEESTYRHCGRVFTFVEEILNSDSAYLADSADLNLIDSIRDLSESTKLINSTDSRDSTKSKFIPHHPMMYYMYDNDLNFNQMRDLQIPEKSKTLSCISSMDKFAFEGHYKRIEFVLGLKKLIEKNKDYECDFYGSGIQVISKKSQGISPYKYSIAIENSQTPHYFSEKIMDCFLGYCMPIYCGAPNIYEYFPKDSFIIIDINNVKESYEIIKEAIENNFYEKHLDALLEARNRCLYEYNFIFGMGKIIAEDYLEMKKLGLKNKKTYHIKATKRTFLSHLKRNLWRIGSYFGLSGGIRKRLSY